MTGPGGYSAHVESTQELSGLAPGQYVVTATAIHTGAYSYAPAVTGSSVTVGPYTVAHSAVAYDTAVSDVATPIPASDVSAVSGTPGGSQTLTLAPGATLPQAGDIVATGISTATPDGFIGRVQSVTGTGGSTVVSTTPATLYDAVPQGSFDVTTTLDTAASGAAPNGASLPNDTADEDVHKTLDCGAAGSVDVTGSLSISPSLHFSIAWNLFHTTITHGVLSASVTEDAELRLTASAAAHCNLGPIPLLPGQGLHLHDFTVLMGVPPLVFPVVFRGYMQLYLSADGEVTASVSAGVSQHFSASAGLEYANGEFTPTHSLDNSFSFDQPSPTTSGNLTGRLSADFSLLVYGAAGPDVNVDAVLDLAMNLNAPATDPWWTLRGGIDAGVGVSIPALSWSWSNPAVLSYRRTLAQASTNSSGGPPAGGTNAIVDGTGCEDNVVNPNDDGSSNQVALPFSVTLWGSSYSSLWVNNNGNVSFDMRLYNYTPEPLADFGHPMIAPFWGDVDTRNAASDRVKYGVTTVDGHRAFCVLWDGVGVGYFNEHADLLNKFQLLLIDRSDIAPGDYDIEFNYDQIQWETGDASGGQGGLGGSSARIGYSDGNTMSFEAPGSGMNGALLDANPTGLIHASHGTTFPGRYIYPVRAGIPSTS